jgi:hypothetical protein
MLQGYIRLDLVGWGCTQPAVAVEDTTIDWRNVGGGRGKQGGQWGRGAAGDWGGLNFGMKQKP